MVQEDIACHYVLVLDMFLWLTIAKNVILLVVHVMALVLVNVQFAKQDIIYMGVFVVIYVQTELILIQLLELA